MQRQPNTYRICTCTSFLLCLFFEIRGFMSMHMGRHEADIIFHWLTVFLSTNSLFIFL